LILQRRQSPAAPLIAVPEIAVDEDDQAPGMNDDVRLARQSGGTRSEAHARRRERLAQEQFRRGIPRAHLPHDRGDFLRLSLHSQLASPVKWIRSNAPAPNRSQLSGTGGIPIPWFPHSAPRNHYPASGAQASR